MTTCTVTTGANGAKCGKIAVTTFTGSNGEQFAECAEHDVSHIAAEARHTGYSVGDTAVVRRHGKDYIGRVVRITRTGKAFVRVTYNNGASRIVEV